MNFRNELVRKSFKHELYSSSSSVQRSDLLHPQLAR